MVVLRAPAATRERDRGGPALQPARPSPLNHVPAVKALKPNGGSQVTRSNAIHFTRVLTDTYQNVRFTLIENTGLWADEYAIAVSIGKPPTTVKVLLTTQDAIEWTATTLTR